MIPSSSYIKMEGKFAEKEQVEAKRIVIVKKVDGKSYSTTKSHSKQEKDAGLKGHFFSFKGFIQQSYLHYFSYMHERERSVWDN
jgi:hypothetical protein